MTPFSVTKRVKKGYILIPTIFSMMFIAMLPNAFQDYDPCIGTWYRTNKFFNLCIYRLRPRFMLASYRNSCLLIIVFLMLVILTTCIDLFSTACTHFGLMISTKKTEVMYQTAPRKTVYR